MVLHRPIEITPTTASILTEPSRLSRLATSGYTGAGVASDFRDCCAIAGLAQRLIANIKNNLLEMAATGDFGCIHPLGHWGENATWLE
jgi:hypothetical protein